MPHRHDGVIALFAGLFQPTFQTRPGAPVPHRHDGVIALFAGLFQPTFQTRPGRGGARRSTRL
ncbi:hypothetical protein ABE957_01795 [Halomonas sp. CS7]|uniref:Uncharacterized protein n=1 Tax=Halomonas pelophila TaxID=3151122 RepID=A0ABV1N4J9_9GAMM